MAKYSELNVDGGKFSTICKHFEICISYIPIIVLATIALQVILFTGAIPVPWDQFGACISAYDVLVKKEWQRLFISSLEHVNLPHLYYNMMAFLYKANSLERNYGSKNFAVWLTFMIFLTNVVNVALAVIMTYLTDDESFSFTCGLGFSGVIFALKVITTCENPDERVLSPLSIMMPGRLAVWVELIFFHLMAPNSSFMGHLAGIIAGLVYCKTFIGTVMDVVIYSITGKPMCHGKCNRTSPTDIANDSDSNNDMS